MPSRGDASDPQEQRLNFPFETWRPGGERPENSGGRYSIAACFFAKAFLCLTQRPGKIVQRSHRKRLQMPALRVYTPLCDRWSPMTGFTSGARHFGDARLFHFLTRRSSSSGEGSPLTDRFALFVLTPVESSQHNFSGSPKFFFIGAIPPAMKIGSKLPYSVMKIFAQKGDPERAFFTMHSQACGINGFSRLHPRRRYR